MKDKSFLQSTTLFSIIVVILACSTLGLSLNLFIQKSSISALTDGLGINGPAVRVVDAITLQLFGTSPNQKGKPAFPVNRSESRNQLFRVIISLTKIAILGFGSGAVYRMILLFCSYSGYLNSRIRNKTGSYNPIRMFLLNWPAGFINPKEKFREVYAEHINGSPGESLYGRGCLLKKKPALFRIIFKLRVFSFMSGLSLLRNNGMGNNARGDCI